MWPQSGQCLVIVGVAALTGAPLASAQTLAGGQYHSVIMTSSGTVWTVGANSDGQLGDNTLTTRKVPILVNGLTNVTAVAAGYNHTLALKSDGTLWTWGDNLYGQLGDGSTTDRKVPVQVTALSNVVAMAAGQYHSVAVTASGQECMRGGVTPTGNWAQALPPMHRLLCRFSRADHVRESLHGVPLSEYSRSTVCVKVVQRVMTPRQREHDVLEC